MIREVVREWKSGPDRGDTNVLIQMLEEEIDHLLSRRNSQRSERVDEERRLRSH
ncbi:hypothetical protein ACG873_30020 [Mesorhizobium sp. AaZ16]|uniref:hypothetical protein n=1 Tax=Mesorhizobium sp. AaZ16 TaxID=3402289 RepID=UPI00374EA8EC